MEAVDCDKYMHMSSTSVYEPKHMNTMESDFDGISKSLFGVTDLLFRMNK